MMLATPGRCDGPNADPYPLIAHSCEHWKEILPSSNKRFCYRTVRLEREHVGSEGQIEWRIALSLQSKLAGEPYEAKATVMVTVGHWVSECA